jgi:LAO/AO transport system kinase
MIETINDRLKSNFYNDPEIEDLLISKENLVLSNKLSSFIAAQDVLNRYFEKLRQGK